MIKDIITHPIFLWAVVIFVVPGIFLWLISYFVASYCTYNATLRRRPKDRDKEKWGRELPSDLPDESKEMYRLGSEWAEKNAEYKNEVHIVNNGLNLYGEYYDLGYERAVMVLSGRTESLRYGYYFAIPYAERGCNVLVVDPRAHGKSDGEFNTVGFEESRDAMAWVRFLEGKYNVKHVIFHGICIGAAGGMLALTSGECPESVDAIVTEGMFANFSESVKNHLIEYKRPVFILLDLIDKWMVRFTGHSMKYGPINVIDKLDKPLLMLHSKEDTYSTPEFAQKLFDLAGSENKRIVWFDHGRHSMLRITDTELYDRSVGEFLAEVYKETNIRT